MGVLIAYTLLRRWMREMAAHVQVEPQRISFHTASYAIVNLLAVPSLDSATWHLAQTVGSPVGAIATLRMLPPRRTGRSFPRVVKNALQIPNEKNASQLLTDWHWPEGGFFKIRPSGKARARPSESVSLQPLQCP